VTTALALPNIAHATLPASYEHAKTALAECNSIDECKDWADKAAALASYAKQADDQTLHNFATRISARAVRRCGELLKQFDARGDHRKSGGAPTSSQKDAATRAGMSKDQTVTAVRVANVPADTFELAIESDAPPTVTRLAELGTASKPAPPGFIQATHAIGTVKDFAAFCAEQPAEFVAGGIYGYEVPKIRAHVATIEAWLAVFVAHLNTEAKC